MRAKHPNAVDEAARDLREIYAAAKKAGDFRAMLRARKELNLLLGLHANTNSNQPPPLVGLKLIKGTDR